MSILPILSVVSMTSREIADLTEKQHSNVMRDIRVMLERLGADSSLNFRAETETYVDAGGVPKKMYRLDKYATLTLISGYDPVLRMRIIRRWEDLETGKSHPLAATIAQPVALLPEQRAESIVGSLLRLAETCKVPVSFALQLAGAEATRVTGLAIDKLLTHSALVDDVPMGDVMLEPSNLGEKLGLGVGRGAGKIVNRLLAAVGLQKRSGGTWEPTEAGKAHCSCHAWVNNGKSGYNLKWNLTAVRGVLTSAGMIEGGK